MNIIKILSLSDSALNRGLRTQYSDHKIWQSSLTLGRWTSNEILVQYTIAVIKNWVKKIAMQDSAAQKGRLKIQW